MADAPGKRLTGGGAHYPGGSGRVRPDSALDPVSQSRRLRLFLPRQRNPRDLLGKKRLRILNGKFRSGRFQRLDGLRSDPVGENDWIGDRKLRGPRSQRRLALEEEPDRLEPLLDELDPDRE